MSLDFTFPEDLLNSSLLIPIKSHGHTKDNHKSDCDTIPVNQAQKRSPSTSPDLKCTASKPKKAALPSPFPRKTNKSIANINFEPNLSFSHAPKNNSTNLRRIQLEVNGLFW